MPPRAWRSSLGRRAALPRMKSRRCASAAWCPFRWAPAFAHRNGVAGAAGRRVCIITDSGRISMKVAFLYPGLQGQSITIAGPWQAICRRAGHTIVPFDGPADAYVINSCTVTAESDRKTRQAIGKAKKHNPDAPLSAWQAAMPSTQALRALTARRCGRSAGAAGIGSASSSVGKRPARAKLDAGHTAPLAPMRKGRARSSSGRVRI